MTAYRDRLKAGEHAAPKPEKPKAEPKPKPAAKKT